MKKILIIEDNKDLNHMLCELFDTESYERRSALDGEEGMEKLNQFNPDLVILDVLLPYIDGREILSNIQQFQAPPVVIVFSTSGWKGISASNVFYCPKGKCSLMQLYEKVEGLLS